jgi:xylulose-5-phosphate/fructose-6-phosphate phosphoketolase
VLPILHLNGYKIANPTVLSRIPNDELDALMTGYGYRAYFVEGHEPEAMHQAMAAALDEIVAEIRRIQDDARGLPDGRVMEVLSEHLCQGWLEGYLLTGRHGDPWPR